MKNQILWSLFTLLLMTFFISCSNEDEILDSDSNVSQSDEKVVPIVVQPIPKLDLEISPIITTIPPITTTACGGVLLDITALVGFRGGVYVTNKGPASLPAGFLEVDWTRTSIHSVDVEHQRKSHGIIPVGGVIVFRRGFYLGPASGPNSTNFIQIFSAKADPNNLIIECDETNNQSSFRACDI